MGTFLVLGVLGQALIVLAFFLLDRYLPRYQPAREVEVTWIERVPDDPAIELPAQLPVEEEPAVSLPAAPPLPRPPLASAPPPPQPEPPRPEPPKKEEKVPELALLPKPPPKPVPPPPPPPPPEVAPPEEEKPKVDLEQAKRMKKVEVDDDEHVVDTPPPEAAYLSDKNRRVAEETRDTRTNLDKISKGDASASEKSEDTESEEIGGEEEIVRQLEEAQASSMEKKRLDPTVHNGKDQRAEGVRSGNKGEAATGEDGRGGDAGKPGALSMRNVEGKGAPGSLPMMSTAPGGDEAPEVALSEKPGEAGEAGRAGKPGPAGKAGKRGPKLDLAMSDYKRIIGEDALREEIEIARRQKSHKKGRWEKKRERLHAALENFTPEVKPGNQTALGTRAAPFAVFIARMHRQIHELWGFGFLEDLDGKSPGDPMNKRDLSVKLEIVLNSDGTVDKATIVRPSGILTFDVAAIDVVENAGPFEEPPAEIRSSNGKIYLHWTFHRDERQCSPYFADPFILDNPPGPGQERGLPEPANAIAQQRRLERIKRNASPTEGGVQVPHVSRPPEVEAAAAAARAQLNVPTPDDPAAQKVALAWLDGFEDARLDVLVGVSDVPFSSGGTVAATDAGELARMWRTILDESKGRKVRDWKLLSPAGYRAVFGSLPKGAEEGVNLLYLAAQIGGDRVALTVKQAPDGSYRVVGFTRQ